ncbi:MAG TPA: HAMP domain-containing sensor histidine kinase [Solirubrobacteraceae bacterium]|jgi:two-component system sensor histidine kinase MprB
MTLRRRITVAAAIAVAVAVVLAAVVAYVAVRETLRGQVDQQLRAQAALIANGPRLTRRRGFPPRPILALPPARGDTARFVQFVTAAGVPAGRRGDVRLPVSAASRAVAAGRAGEIVRDQRVGGVRWRVLTTPLREGGAVELGRSEASIDGVLARLRIILALLCVGGVALAVALGRLVSRNVVAPIVHVTDAARHIAETEDLGRRIDVSSQDEIGELAARFNAMLATLERSIGAQRQLVADASHELRTPVTSLRTNIEVLADDGLPPDERARLLDDVTQQVEELGSLVADLIELARGDEPRRETEDVRVDALVREAIARAARHAPDVEFRADLRPVVVEGTPDRLARAVNNLLDNAARHSRPGGLVEVSAGPAGVVVRDHGEGIDEGDLPHLFDRFYRGAAARGLPGTGLGLAIVRQVAEQHGGSVNAVNVAGGGAQFTLSLPATAPAPSLSGGCAELSSRPSPP